jgi:hypothetical protein
LIRMLFRSTLELEPCCEDEAVEDIDVGSNAMMIPLCQQYIHDLSG